MDSGELSKQPFYRYFAGEPRKLYAVRVRAETIHPECSTEDEMLLTQMFLFEKPEGLCQRCGKAFVEAMSDRFKS
jgi:hypothetical protein